MREHFKIILLSIFIGTIIPPLLFATFIGIFSGEPFIIIYPSVIPIALSMGCPFSLIGSVLLTAAGLKKIRSGKSSFEFRSWVTRFSAIGLSIGVVSSVLVALIVERGSIANTLSGLLYIVPNFLVTSLIVSLILAFAWHTYSMRLRA
jgi:hypothetical protein